MEVRVRRRVVWAGRTHAMLRCATRRYFATLTTEETPRDIQQVIEM